MTPIGCRGTFQADAGPAGETGPLEINEEKRWRLQSIVRIVGWI